MANILYLYTYLKEYTLDFLECKVLVQELRKFHSVTLRYAIVPSLENFKNYLEQTQKQFMTEDSFKSNNYDILIIENRLRIISQEESEKVKSEILFDFRKNGGIVIFMCSEDGQPFISNYNNFLRKAMLPIIRQPRSSSEFPNIYIAREDKDYNNNFIRGYEEITRIDNKDDYFYIEINKKYLQQIPYSIRPIFQDVKKIVVSSPIQTEDTFGNKFLLKGNPSTRLLASNDLWWDGDMYPMFGHFNDHLNGVGVLITGNICLDSIVESQQTDAILFMLNLINLFWKKQQQRARSFNSSSERQDSCYDKQYSGSIIVEKITQNYDYGMINKDINSSENLFPKRTILILASSPSNTAKLRLDIEVREIDEGLRRAQQREQFSLQQRWAVRTNDLRRALLDFNPQIVHFCGHGSGDRGLVLENDAGNAQLVPTNALASLFKLFANQGVECVVLNACYAEVQAEAISQHINYVVGMSDEISDDAALKFAVGFYDALGAGRSYEDAYEFGCNAIALEGISEELTPVLKKKTN
ncbi:CHAT domain-containing protein [Nostoc sp. FACHB-145]|uniref:CHAT domain-containing protein n=1 Tax=Nostoc sp. FACHB-145 TaxID=2692836 RepID=UPI001F54CEA5|nr:CHAT domain-containing protein [Nostoc sp. FACHB-145]